MTVSVRMGLPDIDRGANAKDRQSSESPHFHLNLRIAQCTIMSERQEQRERERERGREIDLLVPIDDLQLTCCMCEKYHQTTNLHWSYSIALIVPTDSKPRMASKSLGTTKGV